MHEWLFIFTGYVVLYEVLLKNLYLVGGIHIASIYYNDWPIVGNYAIILPSVLYQIWFWTEYTGVLP